MIEQAEKDFYKVIEVEKKNRETKDSEANHSLEEAKKALENDQLPSDGSQQTIGDTNREPSEVATIFYNLACYGDTNIFFINCGK